MVGCLLFCVDVTDGAQQCSVLQVIWSDIDGILHRHSLLLRGVRVLVLLVLFVFTKSAVLLYIYYFIVRVSTGSLDHGHDVCGSQAAGSWAEGRSVPPYVFRRCPESLRHR